MRHALFCAILISVFPALSHAADPLSGTADYAYFDGDAAHPERQRIVVIGMNFTKDNTNLDNCQTRTRISDQPGPWHNAKDISKAEDDQYMFMPADNSASADIVETQVKGADGKYTKAVVIGNGTNYWERVRTSGSPHDCIGKTLQIRWCKEPTSPPLGSAVCPNTNYSLVCQNKGDYMVIGVHFASGSVSQVQISFDYSQIDVNHSGSSSDSVLRFATVTDDSNCPDASKFKDGPVLSDVCTPDKIRCFPGSDVRTPGNKDVAIYFVFKRKTWPANLNINNVHIETTMAK